MMSKRKLAIPKLMELVFDTLYLLTVVILGIYFLIIANSTVVTLWGIMALVLAGGDACHLIPRMAAALTNNTQQFRLVMGFGKMLTSITMTIFYLLLWHNGLLVFSLSLPIITSIVYALATIRIILCLFPQNKWGEQSSSYLWGIYRNIPFVILGGFILWLFANYANTFSSLWWMWLAILLSFVFYLPVVLFAHKYPKLGMLMIPKSCAYIWIVCMGFYLLGKF